MGEADSRTPRAPNTIVRNLDIILLTLGSTGGVVLTHCDLGASSLRLGYEEQWERGAGTEPS